jgi:hypothetical protein
VEVVLRGVRSGIVGTLAPFQLILPRKPHAAGPLNLPAQFSTGPLATGLA